MLFDLYLGLIEAGFPIPDYHYLGFGSIFFVDFRILHKLLRVQKMTSIEGFAGIWDRCKNNLPYKNVDLFRGMSSDIIPGLSADECHLVWFDYDFPMSKVVADDIAGLCSKLRPGSLAFFTVDLEKSEEMADDLPSTFYNFFREELPAFAMAGFTAEEFKPPSRELTIVKIMERCIKQGLRGRSGLSFEYLIRLTYADGHRMLTLGGMIADESARRMLSALPTSQLWFLSRGQSDVPVDIPRMVFTPKEIALLEQCFPGSEGLPKGLGLNQQDVDEFRRLYRYWPSYSEALV